MFNNNIYSITNEAVASIVISRFDFDFILGILEDNMNRRLDILQLELPNLVAITDNNFRLLYNINPESNTFPMEVNEERTKIYKCIIDIICSRHNLHFVDNGEVDYCSIAYFMYDFFIGRFRKYLIDFFTLYIYKERNDIYNGFDLSSLKKNKDSSTLYGKKMYKNQKLAIINANLEQVIYGMASFDISFADILNIVYDNKNIVKFMCDHIVPNGNFFRDVYISLIQHQQFKNDLITSIRLSLHNLACTTNND